VRPDTKRQFDRAFQEIRGEPDGIENDAARVMREAREDAQGVADEVIGAAQEAAGLAERYGQAIIDINAALSDPNLGPVARIMRAQAIIARLSS
jgi:hypothetical protein